MRSHAYVAAAHAVVPPASNGRASAHRMLMVPSMRGIQALRTRGKTAVIAEICAPGASPVDLDWRLVEDIDAPRSDDEIHQSRPIVTNVQAESSAGRLSCEVRVPFEMQIFEGHFSSMPIVPGVMQLRWAMDLAAELLGSPCLLQGISAVKFKRLVQPGMEMTLDVEWQPERREMRFDYRKGDTCISAGRLLMGGPHA